MEIIDIANSIREYNSLLKEQRGKLKKYGEDKAKKISDYYKARALVMMKLKNGVEMELEGQKIISPPATIMPEIARGLCYQEKLDREVAETNYKSLIVYIETLKAELNALQSVNRYLDVMPKK